MLRVIVKDSDIPEDIVRLIRRVSNKKGLMRVVGRRVSNELKEHFRDLNTRKRNRNGWKRQNFWNRIAKATSMTFTDENTAHITVSDLAFNAKVYGGTIVPDKAKALAIPLTGAAYGKSPRSQDNPFKDALKLIPRPGKPPILATENSDGTLTAHYVLLKRVTVRPEPEALPRESVLESAIFEEINDFYEREAT